MEDIKIENSGNLITYKSEENHDEDSLLVKYENEYMAFRVAETQEQKIPEIIANMEMHIQISEEAIRINKEKQEMFKKVFEENNVDFLEKIKEIKEKYSEEDLINKAKNLIYSQKIGITKKDGKFVYFTEVSQTIEDLVIDFMQVQEELPELLERLAEQSKKVKGAEERLEKIKKSKKELQERLRKIRVFFATRHKDVDKLLDERAQNRKKGTSEAKELPTYVE